MFNWNYWHLTRLCSKSSILLLLVLGLSLPARSQPRPIIKVVTNQGLIDPVPAGSRWGLPNGMLGTQGNPIPVQDINAVSFKIGDRVNPQWAPGSTEVGSANPQTTFPKPPGVLEVLCTGCNGASPSMTIILWSGLPINVARVMVARVSLGVDATDPNTIYHDGNSILVDIWFARTASTANRAPEVDAGPNQTVEFGQTATLQGSVQDPDEDPLTVLWTLEAATPENEITINTANSAVATFTAPNDAGSLTFQLCADDGKAAEVCDTTNVSVIPPAPTILSSTPESAPPGSSITLKGAGFAAGDAEIFFETIAGLGVSVQDDSTILVTVPSGLSPGPVDITVTTVGGSATLAGGQGGFNLQKRLYFAQFGNGEGSTADVVLTNASAAKSVSGSADFLDDGGLPLLVGTTTIGDEGPLSFQVTSSVSFLIPPLSAVTISTDGQGVLVAGSVVVTADRNLGAVIRFRIPGAGSAGVDESEPLEGFIAPVRRKLGEINTGVGIHNTESESISLRFKLRRGGQEIAQANRLNFPPGGHLALFIDELFPSVDTDDFNGTLIMEVDDGKKAAATALELGSEPGEFTSLPVQPLE